MRRVCLKREMSRWQLGTNTAVLQLRSLANESETTPGFSTSKVAVKAIAESLHLSSAHAVRIRVLAVQVGIGDDRFDELRRGPMAFGQLVVRSIGYGS